MGRGGRAGTDEDEGGIRGGDRPELENGITLLSLKVPTVLYSIYIII